MNEFEKYILDNHPDPDGLVGNLGVYTQMVRLAEGYAKAKLNYVDLADVSKRILGMAQDSANKTSKIYVSKNDKELCEHEFFKGAMWFAQKLNELEYDKFSGSWKIKGEQKKAAVSISTENA